MSLATIQNWFHVNNAIAQVIAFAGIFLISWIAHIILRKIILNMFEKFSKKTKTKWDDMLVKHKVFRKLLVIVPLLMFYYFSYLFPSIQEFVRRISLSLSVLYG